MGKKKTEIKSAPVQEAEAVIVPETKQEALVVPAGEGAVVTMPETPKVEPVFPKFALIGGTQIVEISEEQFDQFLEELMTEPKEIDLSSVLKPEQEEFDLLAMLGERK